MPQPTDSRMTPTPRRTRSSRREESTEQPEEQPSEATRQHSARATAATETEDSSDDQDADSEDFVASEQHVIGVHTKDLHCNYNDWMSSWINHLSKQSTSFKVPSTARAVNTPLVVNNWEAMLADHPNRPLVNFFLSGITEGFHIGFKEQSAPLKSTKRNLSCASQHPEIVENYIMDEITLGRVAGPFQESLFPQAHISRFGVIPKHHQPNK